MDLPVDILLDIFALLPIPTVLALRRTSKTLSEVTYLRPLWAHLFRVHVLDHHIPFPDLPSLLDLESLTRRALTLRRTWSSPLPVPRRQLTFPTSTELTGRVIFLQFLPGRSNQWLISVTMTDQPRSFLLQCWDIASTNSRCVAELRHADGPYGGVVLNSDPSSTAVLAMQSAQTETFSIRFDAEDPESAFETEATIDGIRELHLLCGNNLVTRRVEDGGALCLWDLDHLAQEKVQLLNPSIVQPDDRVRAVHLARDYALVVRVQSLEIYSTTPRQNLVPTRGAPIAYPLAQFRFQWRTDTVVLSEHHAPVSHFLSLSPSPRSMYLPPDFRPRPIHLFIRFATIYPWPVNALHHYVLRPNATYRTQGSITMPTTEYNLPYDLRPSAVHTIGSPVRLFSQSAMALGRYGTALWIDHHTDEWLGPNEHGQRLAGRLVEVAPSKGISSNGNTSRSGSQTRSGTPTAAPTGAEPGIARDLESSGASMVFRMCDDDAWTRIAMEEEAGRIALGHVDGAITLLEY